MVNETTANTMVDVFTAACCPISTPVLLSGYVNPFRERPEIVAWYVGNADDAARLSVPIASTIGSAASWQLWRAKFGIARLVLLRSDVHSALVAGKAQPLVASTVPV